jgi:hypothetical protein
MATATMTTTPTTTTARKTRRARPAAPTTIRLMLGIGSTVYWVRPITSALHARAFRLRKADAEYFVTQDEAGVQACDCGDFTWRHEGKGTVCKHVRALRAARMLTQPDQT